MARELWFTKPRGIEVRDVEAAKAALPAEYVEARALASGISRGTELLLYCGEGPTPFDASLDAPGQPTYPRRYGYSWVGEVTHGSLATGTRIFALAPHGDYLRVPLENTRVLPTDVPPARATLAANLETAVTAVWDGGVGLGDRVVIVGAGVVGLLVARLCVQAGAAEVIVIEPHAKRRQAAIALGVTKAIAPGERVEKADVVFELTGQPDNLAQCLSSAGEEARIVVGSNYGARTGALALGDAFHRKRLQIISSQVSTIPPLRRPRWDHARRFALVTRLLSDVTLDVLIEAPVPFAQAPRLYEELAAKGCDRLQVVFDYGVS